VIYQFENFSLDADRRELRRGTSVVATEPQVFDLLHYLVCNRQRVVSKDDLIGAVWNGRVISESTLSSRMTAVRHAVDDHGRDQRLIRTVARKGFRFVGEVRETDGSNTEVANFTREEPGRDDSQASEAPWLPDRPAIAVLPFADASQDSEHEGFINGIVEDITTALSQFPWLSVVARSSSFAH